MPAAESRRRDGDLLPAVRRAAPPAPRRATSPGARAESPDVRYDPPRHDSPGRRYERIALVDLLDRLLAGGVVISGEVRLAIADVDLVNVSLRALISSVSSVLEHGPAEPEDER